MKITPSKTKTHEKKIKKSHRNIQSQWTIQNLVDVVNVFINVICEMFHQICNN